MTFRGEDQLPAKRHSIERVETYEVERHQFDSIEREATSIGGFFAMATACLPVGVTLTATLKTVSVPDPVTASALWGLMWACYILGIFFAGFAWKQRGKLKRFMQEIRDSQVAPVAAKEPPVAPDLTAIPNPDAPLSLPVLPDDTEER